jgi:hypothetical protein
MDGLFFTIDEKLRKILNQHQGDGHFTVTVRFHAGRIVDYQVETFHETNSFPDGITRSECMIKGETTFINLAGGQDYPQFGSINFDLLFKKGKLIWYRVKNTVRFNVDREK